jgi:hypothetical protein
MDKRVLDKLIQSYYLKGMAESVIWNTEEGKISISFINQTKDCAGEIVLESTDVNLGNHELAFYNTSQLDSLIKVTHNHLELKVVEENNIPVKLNISDKDFDLTYHLATKELIPTAPTISEPEEYDMTIEVDEDFIQKFGKAYSALDKPTRFTVESKFEEVQLAEFIVGESISYANKIKFQHESTYFLGHGKLPFSAPVFREILSVNKDAKTGKIEISEQGLMKVSFSDDNITSKYYLVRLSD